MAERGLPEQRWLMAIHRLGMLLSSTLAAAAALLGCSVDRSGHQAEQHGATKSPSPGPLGGDAAVEIDATPHVDAMQAVDASAVAEGAPWSDEGGADQASGADAPTDTPDLIWSSDFETGDLGEWSSVQACPGGVTVVTSPVRSGHHAARFSVADDDTNAKCAAVPTDNPRAQLVGPFGLFKPGDDVYVGFSTFFPSDFPTIPANGWLMFHEDYGPPFNGSPTMELDVFGDRLGMWSEQNGVEKQIWLASDAIHKGTAWEDIVLHILWSTDPTVGFVEIWLDGVQQTFQDGQQREHLATFVPTVNGLLDSVYMNEYRKAGVDLGTVVLYHDDIRVGRTYVSVAR